jgi:hypothetical protein
MKIKLWMSTDVRNKQSNLHVFIFKNVNVTSKKPKLIVIFTKCESRDEKKNEKIKILKKGKRKINDESLIDAYFIPRTKSVRC